MKNSPALLVMAAGLGSRYGGLKQMESVGPSGESLLDYSIHDALEAGFGKIVFVIRRDFGEEFKTRIHRRFANEKWNEYVYQELDDLPDGFAVPKGRIRPWGTGHAILSGARAIAEPFAVINADDFYGREAFYQMARHLSSLSPKDDKNRYGMIGYILKNTLSESGPVSRGICRLGKDGSLETIEEFTQVERVKTGIRSLGRGEYRYLSGDEVVSMNFWGFTPFFFDVLADQFKRFLEDHGRDPEAEFYIPTVMNDLLATPRTRVKVLPTKSVWMGLTYLEDKPLVEAAILRQVSAGNYPSSLNSQIREK